MTDDRYDQHPIPKPYDGPVEAPIQRHWADACLCTSANNRSQEWQDGFNHAMSVMAFWLDFAKRNRNPDGSSLVDLSRVGMMKSALLGRLMRGEEIRRRPCPKHRGKMWCAWGLHEDFEVCGCNGTGWLPNEPESQDQ